MSDRPSTPEKSPSDKDRQQASLAVHQAARLIAKLDEEALIRYVSGLFGFDTVADVNGFEVERGLRSLYGSASIGSLRAIRQLARIGVQIARFLENSISTHPFGATEAVDDPLDLKTLLPSGFRLDRPNGDDSWGPADNLQQESVELAIRSASSSLHLLSDEVLEELREKLNRLPPQASLIITSTPGCDPEKDDPDRQGDIDTVNEDASNIPVNESSRLLKAVRDILRHYDSLARSGPDITSETIGGGESADTASAVQDASHELDHIPTYILEEIRELLGKTGPHVRLLATPGSIVPAEIPLEGDTPIRDASFKSLRLIEDIILRLVEIRLGSRTQKLAEQVAGESASWPIELRCGENQKEPIKDRIKILGVGSSNPRILADLHRNRDIDTPSRFASWVYGHLVEEWCSVGWVRRNDPSYWSKVKEMFERELEIYRHQGKQHVLRLEMAWRAEAKLLPAPASENLNAWTDAGMNFLIWDRWRTMHPAELAIETPKREPGTEHWSWTETVENQLIELSDKEALFDPSDSDYWPGFLITASESGDGMHRGFRSVVRIKLRDGMTTLFRKLPAGGTE